MRSDSRKSWNFILPVDWTAGDTAHGSFSLRFVVEVNPFVPDYQPECEGCSTDNQVILPGQAFVTVATLTIQPHIVEHSVTDLKNDQIIYPGPSKEAFDAILQKIHNLLPVGDLDHGLTVLPPIEVAWTGPLHENERHVFSETMIKKYLPGGKLMDRQDNVIHVFLFSSASNHDFPDLQQFRRVVVGVGLDWQTLRTVRSPRSRPDPRADPCDRPFPCRQQEWRDHRQLGLSGSIG